ncbi:hypothetical protein [Bacillus sp. ISL-39]|nr:hypothetical protein [Bacillus sp. ISL-39]
MNKKKLPLMMPGEPGNQMAAFYLFSKELDTSLKDVLFSSS